MNRQRLCNNSSLMLLCDEDGCAKHCYLDDNVSLVVIFNGNARQNLILILLPP